MSGRRRLQLREACPVSQLGWGRNDPRGMQASSWGRADPRGMQASSWSRADPRGMQASPCDELGSTKPKCSCCLQSFFLPGSGVLKDPREINSHSHPARAYGEPTSIPLANPVGSSFKIQLAPAHCSPLPLLSTLPKLSSRTCYSFLPTTLSLSQLSSQHSSLSDQRKVRPHPALNTPNLQRLPAHPE